MDDQDNGEDIHVYPLYGQEHVISGTDCWCSPERLTEEPTVVVHNVHH